jgi:hypothetical protein
MSIQQSDTIMTDKPDWKTWTVNAESAEWDHWKGWSREEWQKFYINSIFSDDIKLLGERIVTTFTNRPTPNDMENAVAGSDLHTFYSNICTLISILDKHIGHSNGTELYTKFQEMKKKQLTAYDVLGMDKNIMSNYK